MTPTETVKLLVMVRAAFPGFTVEDGQAQLWRVMIGEDVTLDEAQHGLLSFGAESARYPSAADLRRHALAYRAGQRERTFPIERGAIRQVDPPAEWFELKRRLGAKRAEREPAALGEVLADVVDTLADQEASA